MLRQSLALGRDFMLQQSISMSRHSISMSRLSLALGRDFMLQQSAFMP